MRVLLAFGVAASLKDSAHPVRSSCGKAENIKLESSQVEATHYNRVLMVLVFVRLFSLLGLVPPEGWTRFENGY